VLRARFGVATGGVWGTEGGRGGGEQVEGVWGEPRRQGVRGTGENLN
jgi:hypothetical protein